MGEASFSEKLLRKALSLAQTVFWAFFWALFGSFERESMREAARFCEEGNLPKLLAWNRKGPSSERKRAFEMGCGARI